MLQLQSLDSFPSDAADLLEAVGYMEALELCEADGGALLDELIKANEALGILADVPTADLLESWKEWAREAMGVHADSVTSERSGVSQGDEASAELENSDILSTRVTARTCEGSTKIMLSAASSEHDPEVQSLLQRAPTAESVPAELMKKNKLSVRDIAEGILLADCQGDVEVNMKTPESREKEQVPEDSMKGSGLMTSRIRSFSQAKEEEHHVKPLERGVPREVVSLSKDLNAGLRPDSRRFVRGVLHPEPMRVRVSAFFAVLVQFCLVASFLTIPAVIICDQFYEVPNVIWWLAGTLGCLLLSTISYLIWGLAARCRVCGQRQFAPKKCLKNRKAHHIWLIGYIFPTALHAMFYKWFYCTYCGTAVRLKK